MTTGERRFVFVRLCRKRRRMGSLKNRPVLCILKKKKPNEKNNSVHFNNQHALDFIFNRSVCVQLGTNLAKMSEIIIIKTALFMSLSFYLRLTFWSHLFHTRKKSSHSAKRSLIFENQSSLSKHSRGIVEGKNGP